MYQVNNILIIGTGGIGMALKKELSHRYPKAKIIQTSSKDSSNEGTLKLNPSSEQSWIKFIEQIKDSVKNFDLVISTVGVLHGEDFGPEKKLEDINLEALKKVFTINAFHAPLALKFLLPFLSKKSITKVCFLSAKVGSIEDNQLGGWYSYRASKAALNMFIKTASIELNRRNIPSILLAIHPGTTQTELSRPFTKSVNLKIWESDETAKHILTVIDSTSQEDNGSFYNWDGNKLPW